MWFEERSWSNLKLADESLIEDWRDLWAYKVDFAIVALSYVWATTNLLNLPRLILENGGLAFVSAYGASLLVCVLPIIVLELSIGQLTGRAPPQAFGYLSPIFRGVGISQLLFTFIFLVVTTRYLGWLFLLIYHIFWAVAKGRESLPWLSCRFYPELISDPCREAGSLANFTQDAHTKFATVQSESSLIQFMNALERPSSSIDDLVQLELFPLCAYAAIWGIVLCTICLGVRWMGRVIPLFFFGSIAFFIAVLIRSLFLSGLVPAFEYWYATTDWNVLMDYKVWKLAVEQAILATGCGFGAYISISSYCKRSNNLVKDSFCILLGHSFFTVLQVLLVIAVTGHLSKKTGLTPLDLIDRGENQMWHILSYFSSIDYNYIKMWSGLLLFSCALTLLTLFCVLSLSLLAGLEDAFGEKASRCFPRFVLALLICGACYGASLIFATKAGKHVYELASGYLKYVTLWVILAVELLAAGWFYCAHRLGMDLHSMLRPACCWCLGHFILLFDYLLPAIPISIAVLNAMEYNTAVYSDAVRGWKWYELVGGAIALLPILPIPLFAFCAACRVCCCGKKSHGGKLRQLFGTRLRSHTPLDNEHGGGRYRTPLQHSMARNHSDSAAPPRYAASAPGYLRLPQAPLAEPETYNELR